MIHVLDAHPVLWYFEDNPQLGPATRALFDDPDARIVISTIALAEVAWGLRKKRVFDVWEPLLEALQSDVRVTIYPVTLEVIQRCPPGLEMHDSMICATAQLLLEATGDQVRVVTLDPEIIASGTVNTVW